MRSKIPTGLVSLVQENPTSIIPLVSRLSMRHASSFPQKIPTSVTPNFARGLRTSSSVALDINALIRDNILGLGTTPQIGIMKSLDSSEFSGHPIIFDEPLEPRILEDASQDLIVLSPGLGGGSSASSLYGSWLPISELFGNKSVVVYAPLKDTERAVRFRRGLPIYYDKFYINEEESENFFNKILKNRFFDEEGKLKDLKEVPNLILFGFSIGHRENLSHINYLYRKMLEAKPEEKDRELIQDYFYKIALVNIGSPVNWQDVKLPEGILKDLESGKTSPEDLEKYLSTNPTPEKSSQDKLPELRIINYRSVFDMGTSKPKADFHNFHCRSRLYYPKIFRFERGSGNPLEDMYVMGAGLVRNLFVIEDDVEHIKSNKLGHSLASYVQTLSENPELKIPISILQSSIRFDVVTSQNGVIELVYDPNIEPTIKDRKELETEWSRELARVEAMKLYNRTSSIVNPAHRQGR